MRFVLLALRVALGAVFLYAAYVKLKAPWYMFAASIDSYQMVPPRASQFIARTLPALELLLGLLLLTGLKIRWTALLSGVLLFAFWLSMATAYAKGLAIDCGCFGSGEPVSKLTLLRDGVLVAMAAVLWHFSPKHANIAVPTGPAVSAL